MQSINNFGSIRQIIHKTADYGNNNITGARDYYPYGRILRETNNAQEERFKFTEKERDKETDFDYFGARYYDSGIGRWTTVDPLADKYYGWSPYAYTLCNPLNYFDPDGMSVDSNTATQSLKQDREDLNESLEGLSKAWNEGNILGVIGGFVSSLWSGAKLAYNEATIISFPEPAVVGGITENAFNLGKEGERAVGTLRTKVRIPSLSGTAKFRIPDKLTRTTLTEVKNVRYQSLTRQIRDFQMFSTKTGRIFNLYTRPSTKLSKPLQQLINQGLINHKYIPGL